MVWCPRCGTSLSQHELIDSLPRPHAPVAVRVPAAGRRRRRGARGVDDDALDAAGERARPRSSPTPTTSPSRPGPGLAWVSPSGVEAVFGCRPPHRAPGEGLRAGRPALPRPVRRACRRRRSVAAARGRVGRRRRRRGHRHRPHRAGLRRRGLRAGPARGAAGARAGRRGRRLPRAVRLAARPPHGRRHGGRSSRTSGSAAGCCAPTELTHRFPVCWRCGTELIFRVVDEWFISADGVRERMLAANHDRRVGARAVRQADGRLAAQHGRLVHLAQALLGPAAAVLRGAVGQADGRRLGGGAARARGRLRCDGLEELHRPWIDDIRIRTDDGEIAERVPEVGDCWLDAGIVPFSTLGWQQRQRTCRRATRSGAGEGLTKRRPAGPRLLGEVVPGRLGLRDARADPALVLLAALHERGAGRPRAVQAVLAFEKLNDETGRPMHKSWGNAIWFDDAVEKMGADVMRWLYAGAGPVAEHELRLRAGHRGQEAPADAVEQLQLLRPLRRDRGLPPDVAPTSSRARRPRRRSTATSWPACSEAAARGARGARRLLDADLRGRPSRRWSTTSPTGTSAARARASGAAAATPTRTPPSARSGTRLVQVTRLIAPAMPFLAEELWQNLVARQCARRARLRAPGRLPGGATRELHDAAALARDARRAGRDPAWAARRAPKADHRSCASRWPRPSSSPRRPAGPRARSTQHRAEIAAELNVKARARRRPAGGARRGRGRAELPRARPAAGQGHADGQAPAAPRATTRAQRRRHQGRRPRARRGRLRDALATPARASRSPTRAPSWWRSTCG